jgi:hypothetical protein
VDERDKGEDQDGVLGERYIRRQLSCVLLSAFYVLTRFRVSRLGITNHTVRLSHYGLLTAERFTPQHAHLLVRAYIPVRIS